MKSIQQTRNEFFRLMADNGFESTGSADYEVASPISVSSLIIKEGRVPVQRIVGDGVNEIRHVVRGLVSSCAF